LTASANPRMIYREHKQQRHHCQRENGTLRNNDLKPTIFTRCQAQEKPRLQTGASTSNEPNLRLGRRAAVPSRQTKPISPAPAAGCRAAEDPPRKTNPIPPLWDLETAVRGKTKPICPARRSQRRPVDALPRQTKPIPPAPAGRRGEMVVRSRQTNPISAVLDLKMGSRSKTKPIPPGSAPGAGGRSGKPERQPVVWEQVQR